VSRFIDRRLNGKNKSAVNRQRFIRRYKDQIKKAVSDAIAGRSITDIEKGENISIPSKDISEPSIHHGQGGKRDVVHPGNREFVPGDKIPRPQSQGGQGKGSKATKDGEGEDDFMFELSKEEFMEFFFEDLELPNLTKRQLATVYEKSTARAGFTSEGVPSNINVVRSLTNAYARRIALRSPYKKRLKEAETKLEEIRNLFDSTNPQIKALEEEIELLKRKIKNIPYIDTFDLRFNNRVEIPKPTTQAVMFCVMDVSGSMDQKKKEMAKRFFILLYLFLTRNYKKIEIVFISHHTIAKEVSEEDFFYSRETGGTVVSSALRLTDETIRSRYPLNEWNVYVAQASDGDNWHDDSPLCKEILQNQILPLVQYYAYVEITPENHQSLWYEYESLENQFEHFAMRQLETVADIYPVFRDLFKKQDKTKTS